MLNIYIYIDGSLDCDRVVARSWEKFDKQKFQIYNFPYHPELKSDAHGTLYVKGDPKKGWIMSTDYNEHESELMVFNHE